MSSKRTIQTETVSFRLRPTFFHRLTKSAEERKQSPGEFARELVINALNEGEIRVDVESLREEVLLLREDLITTVAYVLQLSGKLDADEARNAAELLFRAAIKPAGEDQPC